MDGCIFCKIVRGEIPSHKVYEDEHTYAFLDVNPATPYHALVIPKKHYVNVLDITPEGFGHVMNTVKKVVDLYQEKLGMENVQLIHNAGMAGQRFAMYFGLIPSVVSQILNLTVMMVGVMFIMDGYMTIGTMAAFTGFLGLSSRLSANFRV